MGVRPLALCTWRKISIYIKVVYSLKEKFRSSSEQTWSFNKVASHRIKNFCCEWGCYINKLAIYLHKAACDGEEGFEKKRGRRDKLVVLSFCTEAYEQNISKRLYSFSMREPTYGFISLLYAMHMVLFDTFCSSSFLVNPRLI